MAHQADWFAANRRLIEPLKDPDLPVRSALHRELVRNREDPMPDHFSPVAPRHIPHLRPFDRAAHGVRPVTSQLDTVPSPRRTSWTADQLLAETFPDPRWAVPGVLCEGLNLLAGAPKVGKSWFALDIAVAVASGGKALGRIDVEAGDVLYLALEDTPRRMQDRLRKVLSGSAPPACLTVAVECETVSNGGATRIRQWCEPRPNRRLVAVDVFTRVRGRSDPRADRYEADYDAARELKNIADEFGVAVLLLHHTRKATADDFLDSVSGTQGLAGAADAVLVLTRARNTKQAVLKVTGRDVEEAQCALELDASIGAWQVLDTPAAEIDLGDTRRRILECVRKHGAMTPTQIADVTGLKVGTIKVTCRRMVDDDQLDTDGNGRYVDPVSPVTPVTDVTAPGRDDEDGYTPGAGVTHRDLPTSDGYTGYTGYTPPEGDE